ncbi:MAG: cytochrome c [Anaerolineales bacterium]|nr:cytochrome c [Anaerolineales bacterium]MCB9126528.1 cytochrome c [Ardenticatenales bacterium]
MSRSKWGARALLLLVALLLVTGCGQQMANQPRVAAYQESDFFDDGSGMRPVPPNTVPQMAGALQEDPVLYTGMTAPDAEGNAGFSQEFPYEMTMEDLERGHERYDIFCAPCHSLDGGGDGMVVRRGYIPAPSLVQQRLLEQPGAYFYNAITNGFGRMPSYAPQISVTDRWAIAAYVKVLQRSQNATPDDVPDGVEPEMKNAETAAETEE